MPRKVYSGYKNASADEYRNVSGQHKANANGRGGSFSSFQEVSANIALPEAPRRRRAPEEDLPELPDGYGVVLERDEETTEIHIFQTKFTPKEVDDFIKLLEQNPPAQYRYDTEILQQKLRGELSDFSFFHDGACPYEPFLWALKIKDNYIGSIQNNAVPQPWLVECVGKAMADVWDETDPKYLKVLRNALESWDWYQPIHVLLYTYQYLTGVNDEEIDQCIRDGWLYRALYSTTAFYCLCEKKPTEKNIQALLRFVCKDTQRDKNGAEIKINRRMREKMVSYLQTLSPEELAFASTFYQDSLFGCSRSATDMFDPILKDTATREERVREFLGDWQSAGDENQKKRLKLKLATLFAECSDTVVSEVALSRSEELAAEVTALAAQQADVFASQFSLGSMASCADFCQPYAEYLDEQYAAARGNFLNDKNFVVGCAYCLRNHPELMEELCDAHFMHAAGVVNGRYIFQNCRRKYNIQFREQVEKITRRCLEDENEALALIFSCSKIYPQKSSGMYPVEFNAVCDLLVGKVLEEGNQAARYASVLMDLYERIVNVNNRAKYENNLQKLATGTHRRELQNVRNRASSLIRDIYRAV